MDASVSVRRLVLRLGACALLMTVDAGADTITIVPPNDAAGDVQTLNDNDGYSGFRGDVFKVNADTVIRSVGIYHYLTDKVLTYNVWETLTLSGAVRYGATLLRTGSANVTTTELQFIDLSFADLALLSGHNYLVEFGFNGLGRQNFFYNNANLTFAQGSFSLIDGTQNGDTSNTVMPAIRLNGIDSAVTPLPGAATAGIVLLGGLGVARRFRRSRRGVARITSLRRSS